MTSLAAACTARAAAVAMPGMAANAAAQLSPAPAGQPGGCLSPLRAAPRCPV
ncbi:MAG: hypothetical protein R3F11_17740 [Verrucomicrobiales bacterium]